MEAEVDVAEDGREGYSRRSLRLKAKHSIHFERILPPGGGYL